MKRPSSKSKPTPEPARKAIRTQADLARHLGIATETVSRALNDHPKVSQRLRDRVREAAEKLNYRPNAAALSMKTRQFRQVGVILPDNTHRPKQKFRQHMGELLAGINLALETADFSAVIAHVGSIDANRSSFGRILRHNLLDATLVLGNLPTGILQKVEQLTDCTIIVESNRFEATNCIRRDERSAGRLAATKAIEAGYDRFVWFQSSKTPDNVRHFSEQHRVDGVMEVAAENGVMVGRSGPVGWEWDPAEEQAFFDTLTPKTAVLCYDTPHVRWLAAACLRRGARPGTDFGLACCDDIHEFEYTWAELSRVEFDRFTLGKRAGEMLLEQLETGRSQTSFTVAGDWIPGTTLRPVNT